MKCLCKTLIAALVLSMIACPLIPAAVASDDAASPETKWAKGIVRASHTVYVYAPIGGQLEAFDLAIGDDLPRDAVLMEVRPTEVLAPYDGVIRIQHALIGDMAQGVVAQYGALCYLERQDVEWLKASTSTAYDDAKARDIRVGQELRVYNNKTGSKDKREALGRIVSISGTDFVVEFPAGIFDIEETIRVYRGKGDSYKDRDRVGKGKAQRVPPIPIVAEGIIADIMVDEGDVVSRGEPLYALDAADTRHDEAADRGVVVPDDCVLSELFVRSGQRVAKGQLLFTAVQLDDLECVVEVDEIDVLALTDGLTMRVKSDAEPDGFLSATVERVAPLGKIVLDTTKYEVTLRFAQEAEHLLPGMHVTAYWE